MTSASPTPEEAARALTEAGFRDAQVRKADAQLGWMLAILAAAALVVGVLMSLAPHVVGPAVVAIYLGAIASVIVVLLRIRAYSRAGLLLFSLAAVTFTTWNALVSGVSVATRWWAPDAPSFHIGVSEAIGVLPLLVGIFLLARRRS